MPERTMGKKARTNLLAAAAAIPLAIGFAIASDAAPSDNGRHVVAVVLGLAAFVSLIVAVVGFNRGMGFLENGQ